MQGNLTQGNTAPHGIGPGISKMNLGPGSTLTGTLDYGLYLLSCELTEDSLANGNNPLLTVTDNWGTTLFTVNRPGQYNVPQVSRPNGTITVTVGGDSTWRRISLNDITVGERKSI